MVGEAAAFGDSFYSPGADFIALENDCITDMVTRDLRGESRAQVAAMGQRYDRFMALRFDATMLLYRNLYGLIGSRELLQLKWDFDIAGYYNAWLHAYMGDRHLDPAWLDDQLAQGPYTLAGMTHFSRMFQALERKLARDGTYFRSNLDDFALALGRCDVVPLVGTDRSRKSILCHTRDSFNRTYRQAMATAGAPGAADLPDRALFEFMGERPPWADTLPASS